MRILTEKEIKEFEGLVAKARVSIEAIQNYILYATSTPDENCIPDEETFKKGLTTLEQNALDAIKENLVEGEGNISISKMVDKYVISRPVFTNVLQKMSLNNFAEVANQGVKGTYIKIFNKGE